MHLCRSALLACVLLAVAPAAASAADVSISGATLAFAAADGENNVVSVSFVPGTYTLVDTGAPSLTPVAPCVTAGREHGHLPERRHHGADDRRP